MNRPSFWALPLMLALWAGSAFADPPEVDLRLVLQVHTGEAVQRDMTPQQITKARKEALDQTVQATRSRLDQYDVDDPEVELQPGDRISIRLPAVEDPQRVIRLIRSNAQLEFHFVRFPALGGA